MSSSSSTAQAILIASQQYTIYVSFIILFGGVFGHISNIFVFTHLKIFRGNPSACYFIAESIVNLLQMLISFTSRIAINGFGTDLTQTSLFYCKLRPMLAQAFTLISLSIICFASIDQYFSTNHCPYLRNMSKISLAEILITSATITWILHGIPAGIFFEIRLTSGCDIYNQYFINYVTYGYYLILTGILPITISTFFSVLAYRNVRRIVRRQIAVRRRKLDQQLTAMILARVAFFVMIMLPYVLQRIYTLTVTTNKDDLIYNAIVRLVGAIASSLFYINTAVCLINIWLFYLFLLF